MIFLIGALFYSLSVYISYHKGIQQSPWFFPMGILFGIICNCLWLYLAKTTVEKSDLMLKGLYWDIVILACYLFVPLLVFNVELTTKNWIGIVIILIGIGITKI